MRRLWEGLALVSVIVLVFSAGAHTAPPPAPTDPPYVEDYPGPTPEPSYPPVKSPHDRAIDLLRRDGIPIPPEARPSRRSHSTGTVIPDGAVLASSLTERVPTCPEDSLLTWRSERLTCGPARDDFDFRLSRDDCEFLVGYGSYELGLWTAYMCGVRVTT